MYEFKKTEDQELLLESLKEVYERNDLDAYFKECDEKHEFPQKAIDVMVDAGFATLGIPEQYGGTEVDILTQCMVVEQACALGFPNLCWMNFACEVDDMLAFGSPEQQAETMKNAMTGTKPFSLGFTEPNAGSDNSAMSTRAEHRDGKVYINGQKTFITYADRVPYMLLMARNYENEIPQKDMSMYWLPMNTPGVKVTPLDKIGQHMINSCEVYLENVVLDESALVGKKGRGFFQLMKNFEVERLMSTAMNVGMAQAAYEEAARYATERVQFGKTIGSFQLTQEKIINMPKGVMLSDNAICSHALGHLTDICQTGNSVYMCVLPLFHASSSGAIATLIAGATVVVLERFRPKVYLKTIEKYKATALSLTPSMFSALLDEIDEGSYDLTSVKSVIYGAEPILAKYIRKANEKLGCDFYQLFGMSEMGPVITLLRAEDHRAKDDALLEKRLKSVGKVALGAKIKIVAPDGSKCPVGRQGEIYAQGLGQMMCYYNAPDKTASVFSDGWYHTGDVGYLDEDNYLYLVGRMSDMIISGGENVYPKSVEECILALDGVENVAVVGLKDDHLGEAVTAVIVKAPGAELDEATVRNWCKGKIAGFMKPRKVFFVNELPVNSTGKIDKRKLTEMFN